MAKRVDHLTAVALAILILFGSASPARSQTFRAGAHDAGSTRYIPGWAGYVVRSSAGEFTRVHARWTQPRAECAVPGSSTAFWVGLGGATKASRALEQVGTSADCSGVATLSYSAWYELFPAGPVDLPVDVRPGDIIDAAVAVDDTSATITLSNVSSGVAASRQVAMEAPETDSAEWIVEAPSMCFVKCTQLPLTPFDRVRFTGSSTALATHTGAITDSQWRSHRLLMGARGLVKATASPIFDNGASFTVTPRR